MQILLLAGIAVPCAAVLRRIAFLRHVGVLQGARKRYRALRRVLTLLTLAAMAGQELLLVRHGLWTVQTGLPLHLCAVLGLLLGSALTLRSRWLWELTVFLGVPCGLAALAFPAVLQTPAQGPAEVCFYLLHASLSVAPLAPLALGWRPRPQGAWTAYRVLVLYACPVLVLNRLLKTDYLFLIAPAAGTPLTSLAQGGPVGYLLGLMALAAAVLGVMALAAWGLARRFPERRADAP